MGYFKLGGIFIHTFKERIASTVVYFLTFIRWLLIAGIIGVLTGLVGTLFNKSISYVTGFRKAHDYVIYFLPLAGLLIVGLYRIFKVDENAGTNTILNSVSSQEKVPFMLAPLIFVSATLTHLFGGSAGREGAALQLGGGIGFQVGRLFKLDGKDKGTLVVCGMAGLFSALFGTPITAVMFAIEVTSVGVFYYSSLVPSVVSALCAYAITLKFGIKPERFELIGLPKFSFTPLLKITILAIAVALLSIVFCLGLEYSAKYFKKFLKNSYLRVFVGGAIVLAITLAIGTRDYNGAGMDIVEKALSGNAKPFAFALKLILTCVTISCGFKGGEIVPTFFIGSTFGCVVGGLLGLDPAFGAAIGLVAMFCGVVNCPVASIILSIELFQTPQSILFFALACGISYVLSGYYGLYASQKIVYSKLHNEFINIHAK